MPNNKITRRLAFAKEASLHSNHKQHKLGCVAYYKGAVLAIGYNDIFKTSPVQKKYNRLRGYDVETAWNTIHAEMMVLAKIRYLDIDFSKVTLYIYRGYKNGDSALARPCKACMAAIADIGIKQVYYTTDNGWCMEYINKLEE